MSASQARLVTTLIGLALALAACGPAVLEQSVSTASGYAAQTTAASQSHQVSTVTARSSAAQQVGSTAAPMSATAGTAGQVTVAVYFTAGSNLVRESRQVPAATPARGSLEALLAGPKAAGHFSQVPAGTRLLSVALSAGTATVDLSNEVQNIQGSPAIPLFLGQIVDTLTQFPDVQRVVLEVNGRPLRTLGGEGAAVPEPLDRAAVQRMLTGQ